MKIYIYLYIYIHTFIYFALFYKVDSTRRVSIEVIYIIKTIIPKKEVRIIL